MAARISLNVLSRKMTLSPPKASPADDFPSPESPYQPPSRKASMTKQIKPSRVTQSLFNEPSPPVISDYEPKLPTRAGIYVTPDIVARLVQGEWRKMYDELVLVDCRFGYEFEGGHIMGAINLNSQEGFDAAFKRSPCQMGTRMCVIFYCEFSSCRGPGWFQSVREWDRKEHELKYPQLYYPEMYVLEGGYRGFFNIFKEFCYPQQYIPMKDRRFKVELQTGLSTIRKPSRSGSLTLCPSLSVPDFGPECKVRSCSISQTDENYSTPNTAPLPRAVTHRDRSRLNPSGLSQSGYL